MGSPPYKRSMGDGEHMLVDVVLSTTLFLVEIAVAEDDLVVLRVINGTSSLPIFPKGTDNRYYGNEFEAKETEDDRRSR